MDIHIAALGVRDVAFRLAASGDFLGRTGGCDVRDVHVCIGCEKRLLTSK